MTRHAIGVGVVLALSAVAAGCSGSTTGSDAGSAADSGAQDAFAADVGALPDSGPGPDVGGAPDAACTPPADNPMRGMACTMSSDCPTGYDCQASFTTATTCDITCTPETAACVCPTGLGCEVPAGHVTGICS